MAKTDTAAPAADDAAAKAAADTAAKAAADKATADQAAADKATADKAASDKAAADKAAADTAAAAGTKPEGAEGTKDGKPAGTGGAPEKYALTIPKDGAVDATDVATVEKIAREHGLSNEEAQGVLDKQNAYLIEQSEGFAAQLTADPDYGGDKLAETQRLAKSVIDAVRPEGHPRRAAFQRLLDKSGAGNHIEVASFFADLGKKLAEDTPVAGPGGSGGNRRDKPLANRMYPDMK